MVETVIQIEGLAFHWPGTDRPCLDIPRFQVEAGEHVFLHGPSGSGKSTLLNVLGGVLTPQTGHVRVLGHDLRDLSPAARDRYRVDHVGFIFQQFNLISYLPVLDNVLLPCRFSARRRHRALEQAGSLAAAAGALLAHLDLEPALWSRPATQLSVGQQQRVAAARALLGQPELVIADEPTSSLDAERQAAFLELLRRECGAARTTLLFVSHDRRLAAGFTREVALHEINRSGTEAGQAA